MINSHMNNSNKKWLLFKIEQMKDQDISLNLRLKQYLVWTPPFNEHITYITEKK